MPAPRLQLQPRLAYQDVCSIVKTKRRPCSKSPNQRRVLGQRYSVKSSWQNDIASSRRSMSASVDIGCALLMNVLAGSVVEPRSTSHSPLSQRVTWPMTAGSSISRTAALLANVPIGGLNTSHGRVRPRSPRSSTQSWSAAISVLTRARLTIMS